MKLGHKFIIAFLLVAVVGGVAILLLFQNVNRQLADKQKEIDQVTALTLAIQDFHIENFHEQLEMWEYAYEPNEKRLNAFYGHLITWERLFAEFLVLANEADLTTDEHTIVHDMQTGIVLVRQSWLDFVNATESVATGVLESATLKDDGTEKYPLLDDMAEYGYDFSYPMFDMSTCDASDPTLFAAMVALEDLFDEAYFNKNTDKFVELQQAKLAEKQAEMENLYSSLNTQFIVAIVIVLVIACVMAIGLSRIIVNPIRKLTEVANEVSQGKTDLTVPESKSNDEIGELSKSFGRMVASIKFMMTDKEE